MRPGCAWDVCARGVCTLGLGRRGSRARWGGIAVRSGGVLCGCAGPARSHASASARWVREDGGWMSDMILKAVGIGAVRSSNVTTTKFVVNIRSNHGSGPSKIFRLRRALFTKKHTRFLHLIGAGPDRLPGSHHFILSQSFRCSRREEGTIIRHTTRHTILC